MRRVTIEVDDKEPLVFNLEDEGFEFESYRKIHHEGHYLRPDPTTVFTLKGLILNREK